MIDGRVPVKGHGGPDMPLWGDAFKRSGDGYDEAAVRARIDLLVTHLESIQVALTPAQELRPAVSWTQFLQKGAVPHAHKCPFRRHPPAPPLQPRRARGDPMTERIQIDRILCPVDFSMFSARALRHAAALARRFEARLVVLHVVPQWQPYANMPAYYPEPMLANPVLCEQVTRDVTAFVADAVADGRAGRDRGARGRAVARDPGSRR